MLSPARILQAFSSARDSQLVLAGIELGLFTELAKGPRSCLQISQALGVSTGGVARWLDALVALGLIDRDGIGEHALYLASRASSHFLDRNSPAYIGAHIEGIGSKSAAEWQQVVEEA
jgi:predicted transcriptional regulator